MSRTDRRPRRRLDPDERRAALLAAAAAAFAEHSYAEVTVSSIAERAGASDALLYRYFAGKEELYAAIVRLAVTELMARQADAVRALEPGVPVRDRLRATLVVYLDHIADHADAWAMPMRTPGVEPAAGAAVRVAARRDYADRLESLLGPSAEGRHDYAVRGYLGFVDAACLRWVDHGCPDDEREPLIAAALGALEGALGDWSA